MVYSFPLLNDKRLICSNHFLFYTSIFFVVIFVAQYVQKKPADYFENAIESHLFSLETFAQNWYLILNTYFQFTKKKKYIFWVQTRIARDMTAFPFMNFFIPF